MIEITENGTVRYDNQPDVERELLANIKDNGYWGKIAQEAAEAAEAAKDSAEAAAEQAMSGTPEGYADLVDSIAPAYSSSATYAAGDYVLHDSKLYKANQDIGTAEAWTSAHWTFVRAMTEVGDLKDALTDVANLIASAKGDDYGGWVSGKNVISDGTIGSSNTFSASDVFIKLPEYVTSVTYKTTTYSGFVGTYTAPDVSGFIERKSVSANSSITLDTSIVKYIRISVSSLNISDAGTLSWSWDYPMHQYAVNALTAESDLSTALSSGADLDNINTPGNYRIGSNAIALSLLHKPSALENAGRLFVIETSAANRLLQMIIANTADTKTFMRYYTGSVWSNWFTIAKTADTVAASNIMVTSSNYETYFPNGSFNDAIPNSIYGISTDVPLTDGPAGDEWIGTPDKTSGYIRGTLMTFTQSNVPTGKYSGLVQLLIGYRNTNYKPTLSYRIATVSEGAYIWSNWSKFEENGYLHASNQIIYGGSFDKTIDDLNDAEPNSIYQIDLNCDSSDAAHTLGHHPCPGVSSVMMCYAFSYTTKHGMVQTLFNVRNEMYYRYGYLNNPDDYRWTDWMKVTKSIPDAPSANGTYILQCTVSGGVKTYAWVSAE